MKFEYPYKQWFAGLILFSSITLWGGIIIYDIKPPWYYWIGYIVLCYLFIDWYWSTFKLYKSKYVKIAENALVFSFMDSKGDKEYTYEEIEYIFNSKHRQRLKTHNVTHFFMKNGDYYFITREINNYNRFKGELEKKFPNKYYIIEDSFQGIMEGDKKQVFLEKINNKTLIE